MAGTHLEAMSYQLGYPPEAVLGEITVGIWLGVLRELIAMALRIGCLFSIDSDAHAPGQLSLLDHGAARAEKAGVPADRIVTTWPLDRLREWTDRPR